MWNHHHLSTFSSKITRDLFSHFFVCRFPLKIPSHKNVFTQTWVLELPLKISMATKSSLFCECDTSHFRRIKKPDNFLPLAFFPHSFFSQNHHRMLNSTSSCSCVMDYLGIKTYPKPSSKCPSLSFFDTILMYDKFYKFYSRQPSAAKW